MKTYKIILTTAMVITAAVAWAGKLEVHNENAHTLYIAIHSKLRQSSNTCSPPLSHSSYDKKTGICTITTPAFLASLCSNTVVSYGFTAPAGKTIIEKFNGLMWSAICPDHDQYCYNYTFDNYDRGVLRIKSDGSVVVGKGLEDGKKKVKKIRSTEAYCLHHK